MGTAPQFVSRLVSKGRIGGRTLTKTLAGLAFLAATTATAGAWQRAAVRPPAEPRTGITVYEDINFGGRTRTFTLDVDNLRASGLNDRISSLVVARGEAWEICVDPDFRGRCSIVSGSDANLVESGWNDRISSMRRVPGGGGGFPPGRGRGGGEVDSTVELFAGLNYSGQRIELTEAVPNFGRIGFNDRAMSARVRGGWSWEVCVNADYDDCRVITGGVPNLDTLGLRRIVSSARPRFGGRGGPGGGGGIGRPPTGPPQIILYTGLNFTGTAMEITAARSTLGAFNDRALSVRVIRGRWEICDDTRFDGRCQTIEDDVRDLRTLRLDRRIQSVRPR